MKSETLITALVTAGTLFLTKIMLDDVILRTKKDELERRLENAMRNYEESLQKKKKMRLIKSTILYVLN